MHRDALPADVPEDAATEAVRPHPPDPDRRDPEPREADRDVAVCAAGPEARVVHVGEVSDLGRTHERHGLTEREHVSDVRHAARTSPAAATAARQSPATVARSPAAIAARGTIQLPPTAATDGRAR